MHLTEEIERRDGLVYKAKTRSALIGLGFKESELDSPVKNLSGGQRSKVSLCKKFKSVMNCSIMEYVSRMRLSKAKLLLRDTNKSIEEIAVECGFEGD